MFQRYLLIFFLSLQTSFKTSSFAVLACNQALQWERLKNSVNPKAIISIYRNRASFLKVCNSYVEGNRLVSSLFGILKNYLYIYYFLQDQLYNHSDNLDLSKLDF